MPNTDQVNLFSHAAYSPLDKTVLGGVDLGHGDNDQPIFFSGGDINIFFNERRVGRVESISCSIATDGAQLWEMGQQDSLGLVKGKRQIAGSMMFAMGDKDAVLESYLRLSERGTITQKDLWDPSSAASSFAAKKIVTQAFVDSSTVSSRTVTSTINYVPSSISESAFNDQSMNNVAQAARIVGSRKIEYLDQLPPIDVTIVAVKDGAVSAMVLFGVEFLQEAMSMTLADMSSSQATNFVCRHRRHWRRVTVDGMTPGVLNGRP